MSRIEFVGNALFIPYFLIGVGMLIDVHALFDGGEALTVAIVMTVTATLSKWIAAWLTQKSFRMQVHERTMVFGLSNAHAAATLAVIMVGNNIEVAPGVMLLSDNVLNGAVVMILFTCIISSIATERAARKMVVLEATGAPERAPREEERIMIPIANPDTIVNLVGMALLLRDPKRKSNMVALSVMNDSGTDNAPPAQAKRNLDRAVRVASAVDVDMQTVIRYDLNVASGIIHAMKEYNASETVIGLHYKMKLTDSFFGRLTENLIQGTYKQVMIVKCLMPVNTLRRIVVAVPPKAEYEAGFLKWVERLCRIGTQLGCLVHFYGSNDTLHYIQGYTSRKHKSMRREFSELAEWDDLLILAGQVNYDHLFVVVSARKGFISYRPSFDRLPEQISHYFNNCSLMMIYPDQYGDPQETLSFSEPRHHPTDTPYYDKVGRWFYRWFKKE
jgi:hypothetical protein